MITREENIKTMEIDKIQEIKVESFKNIIKDGVFFDLEHYIYKKPICIGVFGACFYDEASMEIKVTQYMIENREDSIHLLNLAKDYFVSMKEKYGKKYIITFSGNNDFVVINYLFEKYGIDYSIEDNFKEIDLQKYFEKISGSCIGLKALEKDFGIIRESELISGSNLAKTFAKIFNDDIYITRMPEEKKEKILLYNQQDVVSLYEMCRIWENIKVERIEKNSMFTRLRRESKEICNIEISSVMNKGEYGVLGTIGENGYPYTTPINYVYYNDAIYFHCAKQGNKIENINFCSKVSFCVVVDNKVLPEKFTSDFSSVIAFGEAKRINDQEKLDVLKEFIIKYSPEYIKEGLEYIDKAADKTEVIKINVQHITGKKSKN